MTNATKTATVHRNLIAFSRNTPISINRNVTHLIESHQSRIVARLRPPGPSRSEIIGQNYYYINCAVLPGNLRTYLETWLHLKRNEKRKIPSGEGKKKKRLARQELIKWKRKQLAFSEENEITHHGGGTGGFDHMLESLLREEGVWGKHVFLNHLPVFYFPPSWTFGF